MNPYSYERNEPYFRIRNIKKARNFKRYIVSFSSAHPTRFKENNTVWGEYFEPSNENAPLMILVHGMGDRSIIPCRALAHYLVKRGIACFVLYLVMHSVRMAPAVTKGGTNILTTDDWFESYRISVIDIRQVIDWAYERENIDDSKIAVAGISFGGFISAIAMGVDQRIRAGILMVSGGNLEKIAHLSKTLPKRLNHHRSEEEFKEQQERYHKYLKQVARRGFEQVDTAERGFLTDPMTFAHRISGRPLLMVNARCDEVIPRQAVVDFWNNCGKPHILWLPGGHITVWVWYPIIERKIGCFLNNALQI